MDRRIRIVVSDLELWRSVMFLRLAFTAEEQAERFAAFDTRLRAACKAAGVPIGPHTNTRARTEVLDLGAPHRVQITVR